MRALVESLRGTNNKLQVRPWGCQGRIGRGRRDGPRRAQVLCVRLRQQFSSLGQNSSLHLSGSSPLPRIAAALDGPRHCRSC
mgnify:CR=1 FL=1